MILLALDTTSAVASAALFRDGRLVDERAADSGKKHAETALPLLDELLEENGVSIENVDLFAVDIGPGSFTGVRIGVSLVNALAFATGKKVVPVNALFALYTASGERERPVCAMIDARNGNAYAALYQAGVERIVSEGAEIEAFLTRVPADTAFVGDVHAAAKTYPQAEFVGRAALLRLETALDAVEPLYLRPPQAERLRTLPVGEI
ncbi:MAG: tRNA (adenosine(37)-N6)-threonylcarbamoyltransferase complex dimerization subunit type 1 TsaB [Eubacteriales bacterium]|nr:tRNA (adenosine(37)-N6)-threonylcarbamoyltransferase complex dimerization subunit type 1 TsaB [Eubacteriales bacterium]